MRFIQHATRNRSDKIKLSILAMCGLMLFAAEIAGAATFYVSTSGSDSHSCAQAQNPATPKRNIQSSTSGGVSCLGAGDTLYIRGGSYRETIRNWAHGGWAGGTGESNRTLIAGYPGEEVILYNPGTGPQTIDLMANVHCIPAVVAGKGCDVSYTTFRNLIVDGESREGQRSVSSFAQFIRFEFVTVRYVQSTAFFGPAYNNVFQDCTVHDTIRRVGSTSWAGTYGWYIGGDADNVTIERCTVYNISGFGVHNWSDQDTSNVTIRDSHFYNTGTDGGDAILISHGPGHQVYNNLIENTVGFGITLHATCRDCKVFNNKVINTVIGIDVGRATNPEVSNNVVMGSSIINICPRDAASIGCEGGGQTGEIHVNNLCDRAGIWCDAVSDSVPPNPPPPPPPAGGSGGDGGSPVGCNEAGTNFFVGCYYNEKNLTNLVLTQNTGSIDFDWGSGSPDSRIRSDDFSARWRGNFDFVSGQHDFVVTADDGVRLYIDGQLVLDRWIDQPPTSYTVTRSLSAGRHEIVMEYYERGGGAVARLSFSPLPAGETAPDTSITSAPAALSNSTIATFAFSSTATNSPFSCALDAATFTSCTSPKTYKALTEGNHTFRVKATGSAGATDQTPATFSWVIDAVPPETDITSNPPPTTGSTDASFSFTSTEANSTFACSLDGAAFTACSSPTNYSNLAGGNHAFRVRAIDGAGNFDTSPASYSWAVTTTASPVADITVTPRSLGFGAIAVRNQSADQVITVKNDGTVKLRIFGLRIVGVDRDQFSKTDKCSNKALAVGASCTVSVRFKPTSSGAKAAVISIPSQDPDENPFDVSLSGTGIP